MRVVVLRAGLQRAHPLDDHACRGWLEVPRPVGGLTGTGRRPFRDDDMDPSIAMDREAARALGRADEAPPDLSPGVAAAEVAGAAECCG